MENKINIAEILKDCPKGMELYSPIFGEVYLDKIRPHLAIVVTTDKEQGDFKEEFLYDGRYGMNGECMLYPSKDKTTWEGYQRPFKDGDIVISEEDDIHLLRTKDSSYCAYRERWKGLPKFDKTITMGIKVDRLATEEEKQKLFDAIKENGYHWNTETKTLEELVKPKFKVDDKIKLKGGDEFGIITQVADCFYTIKCKNKTHCWPIKKQDDWELINKPKFKVGDRIKYIYFDIKVAKVVKIHDKRYELDNGKFIEFQDENAYEISYDKFDITTLKPFDKVLTRANDDDTWVCNLYSHHIKDYYVVLNAELAQQCIPYEENKHLLNTNNDCDNYYKTWK